MDVSQATTACIVLTSCTAHSFSWLSFVSKGSSNRAGCMHADKVGITVTMENENTIYTFWLLPAGV